MGDIPKPEWVKLIPADSIPVFCFAPETLDRDLERYKLQLQYFFGERKVLVIRGDVEIYAIADAPQNAARLSKCICGGEPHVSHCPANTDPFLKVNV